MLPLSHSIVDDSFVPSENPPLRVHKVSRRADAFPLLHEGHISPLRKEANIHALLLPGGGKALFLRLLLQFLLVPVLKRECQHGQLFLRQPPEHIALILFFVLRPPHKIPPVLSLSDPSVVTGGHPVKAILCRKITKYPDFYIPIALHTGVGRAPLHIALGKRF